MIPPLSIHQNIHSSGVCQSKLFYYLLFIKLKQAKKDSIFLQDQALGGSAKKKRVTQALSGWFINYITLIQHITLMLKMREITITTVQLYDFFLFITMPATVLYL